MTGVLIRSSREEGHVKREAEIRVMLPETKEHERLPAISRS